MNPITIISRIGEIQGYGDDEVVYFDRFDDRSNKVVRNYVLLNEGVKLMYEPFGWKNEWYVDLIKIETINDSVIKLTDLYIDVVIEGNGPTYRIIDLEEYADAVNTGMVQLQDIKTHLTQIQLFLDNYLHKGNIFPPKRIIEMIENNG